VTAAPRPSIAAWLATAGLPPLPRTAWLELDLDALGSNLGTIRELAGASIPTYPVVKANAYGHGALEISRALEAAGASGFCVAAADEAAALRDGGITRPIHVLFPAPATFTIEAARRGITLSAGDVDALDPLLDAAAAAAGGASAGPPLELELEVETGLGRGGFMPSAIASAARRVSVAPGIRLAGLWTHLQATEDKERTADQLARFDTATAILRDAGVPVPPRHVAASGGVLTDVAPYEGIRPGLALYGILPDELDPARLRADIVARFRPVMSLRAQPVRVADLPAGHGVSYGPTFTTQRPSRIATLPLGYGDGYARSLSNRAQALVRGRRVPLVGNIAMDALMADVTDVPGPPVTIADEFTLLGAQEGDRIPVEELAQLRTTNTWEVVTGMSGRLPRVYHAASGPVGLRTLTSRGG
jgi:alanine racemase